MLLSLASLAAVSAEPPLHGVFLDRISSCYLGYLLREAGFAEADLHLDEAQDHWLQRDRWAPTPFGFSNRGIARTARFRIVGSASRRPTAELAGFRPLLLGT